MKKYKSIASVFLAVVMVLSMVMTPTTALAQESTTVNDAVLNENGQIVEDITEEDPPADEEIVPADEDEITYPAEYFLSTPAETYNLWVGDRQVTSDNAADVFGDGTVSYDATEGVLKLKNASIAGSSSVKGTGIYADSLGKLIIETEGNNTVTGNRLSGSSVYGIECYGTDLVFCGSGTLTIDQNNLGVATNFYGINTLTSGKTITVESGTVTTRGQKSSGGSSYGIYWLGGNLKVTGGSLIAEADTVTGTAEGIHTKSITVTDGSLTARSSKQAVNCSSGSDFTVGGKLDIAASSDDGASYVDYDFANLSTYNRIDVVPAYDLYVGGVRVNEANKGNIPFTGDGTASYDPSTGVLKLKNAQIKGKKMRIAEGCLAVGGRMPVKAFSVT